MKKKTLLALLAAVSMTCSMTTISGIPVMAEEASTEDADQAAADNVAALIDKIYVQERNETTDEDCAAAKEAWDNLTDAQKELVEGEEASPEYFGLDTGDASLDDPRNADEIGENELLVVSFGTSYNGSRAEDIKGIEDALQEAYPDWSVRRAFTAQIIINHVQAREDEKIDNMEQALERAVANGVKNLVVQPTHLMHGAEYDEMVEMIEEYADQFESVAIAEPMLGEVGEDATVINEDKAAVAQALTDAAVAEAGYDSMEAAAEDGVAFVFMGHGTSHTANVTYDQMQTQMENLGFENAFIGTVEGKPEDTACDAVIEKVAEAGYSKVILRPLMVVAGDHANNDMAGDDEDSWKSMFMASGNFESVDCQISGLGRIPAVQELYVAHTQDAIDSLTAETTEEEDGQDAGAELADGVYTAEFDTDSSMFHVNEANDGCGTLTVENGQMTIHVSLVSQNIVNLFVGTSDEAQQEGAELLQPTVDTVTYSDGTSEEVYGFDIPVPALDEEFDVALIGTKGTWYDHKVSVTNPQQ
jgi:cobalamin biosynthesis Co2+ chelatase CbiK